MLSDRVIMIMLAVLVIMVLTALFGRAVKAVARLVCRSAVGAAAIFAVDFLLSPMGLFVGINAATVLITGILGVPGFVMLYAVMWILR
jgi:inhibitor of the pro-sigma K processing machinery